MRRTTARPPPPARTRATFHRFAEALADLDAAGRRGADRAALQAEWAAILQAVGCYVEARALRRDAAERRPELRRAGCAGRARGRAREGHGGRAPVYRRAAPLPRGFAVPRRRTRLPARRDVARGARPPRCPCLVRRRREPGAGLRPGARSPRRGRRGPRTGTPPSTACARSRRPVAQVSRPVSRASSAMPGSPWRPSTGA